MITSLLSKVCWDSAVLNSFVLASLFCCLSIRSCSTLAAAVVSNTLGERLSSCIRSLPKSAGRIYLWLVYELNIKSQAN